MQIYDKMNDLSLENYFQKYSNLFKKYRLFHSLWIIDDATLRHPGPDPDTLKSLCDWLVVLEDLIGWNRHAAALSSEHKFGKLPKHNPNF